MRHTSGKTNEGLSAEIRRCAVFSDIGKVALDPDNELVTYMAVVGKRIVGRESHNHFSTPGCQTATQGCDLRTGRDALARKRLPNNLIEIDGGLILPKDKGCLLETTLSSAIPVMTLVKTRKSTMSDARRPCRKVRAS
jgi:hypothetical protein